MKDVLHLLHTRNSAPKLTDPGPTAAELEQILRAALRAPDATARDKALAAPLRAPMIIVVVCRLSEHPKVPHYEQRLSAGCAAQGALLAAEALGLAGIWRTGDVAFDRAFMTDLGLVDNEEIVGFLYLGTRLGPPKPLPELDPDDFNQRW